MNGPVKLKGHRLEQLQALKDRGAVSRETAVPTSLGYSEFRPGTLSRMFGEGLVANGYLPVNGDPKRRAQHYWLTEAGLAAIVEGGQ